MQFSSGALQFFSSAEGFLKHAYMLFLGSAKFIRMPWLYTSGRRLSTNYRRFLPLFNYLIFSAPRGEKLHLRREEPSQMQFPSGALQFFSSTEGFLKYAYTIFLRRAKSTRMPWQYASGRRLPTTQNWFLSLFNYLILSAPRGAKLHLRRVELPQMQFSSGAL